MLSEQAIKGKMENVFPAGLEPTTFRVLGGRDNHYITETANYFTSQIKSSDQSLECFQLNPSIKW